MVRFLRQHPRTVVAGSILAVGFVVFVLVWFEPQKLFLNQTVDEAVPSVSVAPQSPPGTPDGSGSEGQDVPPPAEPVDVAGGSFRSLEHSTSGRATLIELPDGSHILRFVDLDTSNGPDLRVYLSEVPAGDDWHAYGERFVDLGALKGNLGNQNYRIPPGVDIRRYRSAVIWCRRFTVGFGVAPLTPR